MSKGMSAKAFNEARKASESVDNILDESFDKGILNTNIEEKLNNLEERYEPRLSAVDARVDDVNDYVSKESKNRKRASNKANKPNLEVNSNTTKKPMVTFIDDDGTGHVLTKLKPLVIEKQIPITLAIISDGMDQKDIPSLRGAHFMNVDEVTDLYENYGFEIQSHSSTHPKIAEQTEEQQIYEIENSYKRLNDLGFNVEYLIYPYGSQSKKVREKVSEVYKGALGTGNSLESSPIKTFNTNRIALGSFTGVGENTLEFYKSKVDEAIENNQWLIFMTHAGNPNHDEIQQQHLSDVIDYCKSQDVDIVTVKEGYERSGNIIDVNDQELYLSKDGSNNIRDTIYNPLNPYTGLEIHDTDSPPSDFEDNKVTVDTIASGVSVVKTPSKRRGTLVTFKNPGVQSSSQIFYSIDDIYYRYSENNVLWRDWVTYTKKMEEVEYEMPAQTIAPNSYKRVTIFDTRIRQHYAYIPRTTERLEHGISYTCMPYGHSAMDLKLFNSTNEAITTVENTWIFKVID